MEISDYRTPYGESIDYIKVKGKFNLWVLIEEKNPNLPQSQLFRVRLGAKNKSEANNIIDQFTNNMTNAMKNSLNIRIERI